MIICNNCVGGWIYNILNVEYDNPFIWVIINDDSFINLMQNFNNINFNNIKLEMTNIPQIINRQVFTIIIDNIITVTYPHHIEDINFDTPTKCKSDFIGWDIRYKDMKNYLLNKYNNRIKRMLNKKPIFIIDTSITSNETNLKFEQIQNDNKIMCISRYNYKPITNIKYINVGKCATKKRAQFIINKYGDFIKNNH